MSQLRKSSRLVSQLAETSHDQGAVLGRCRIEGTRPPWSQGRVRPVQPRQARSGEATLAGGLDHLLFAEAEVWRSRAVSEVRRDRTGDRSRTIPGRTVSRIQALAAEDSLRASG